MDPNILNSGEALRVVSLDDVEDKDTIIYVIPFDGSESVFQSQNEQVTLLF
jgi:hypothetical protein